MVLPALAAGLADSAWPKSGYDLNNTGQSSYAGPQSNTVAWTYTAGGYFLYGGPSIGPDGTIYISNLDKKLYAFYPNGTLRWTNNTGMNTYSTLAIDSNGTIYGGSDGGKLYAINPDGTFKWEYTTGDYLYGSPAIGSDGTVYAEGMCGNLFAVYPNGTLNWTYQISGDYFGYGTPAIGPDGIIYAGGYISGKLYAVNPDGTSKWTYTTGGAIYSAQAIATDGTIYVGSDDNKLYAVNPDGTSKWTYTTGGSIYSAPAIAADGTIYIGSDDNKLYAVNPDGTSKWTYDCDNPFGEISSPIIGLDGIIYIGDTGGKFYAINPDGTLKWEYTTDGRIYNSGAIGSDGTLYVGSEAKTLYAFRESAEFSAGPKTGGAPLNVQFTDQSTGSPSSWSWDFGDGDLTNSTEQNPLHTYTETGLYSVSLTVTYTSGSSYSEKKIDYINVSTSGESAPIPGFTTDVSSGNVPFTVHFNDTTTGNVSRLSWDFDDGDTSEEQNPVHTYLTEGTYTVTLTATGPGGFDTATAVIRVAAPLNSGSYDGGVPLNTVQESNVSGGLWYDSWPGFDNYAEKTFTLPAYTEIKWARLYLDVYCGNMVEDRVCEATIDIDADGDGTYGRQEHETLSSTYSGTPVWLSDHLNRVTSDYFMWYDLTDDEINGSSIVNVKASGGGYDGRIKHITLVVAYDDGDDDEIYYWVNQGHDTANSGSDLGSAGFETSSLSGFDTVNLTSIYCASVDGAYTFNDNSLSSGGPSGEYFGHNDWDVTNYLSSGKDSTLKFTNSGGYYKIQLALLTASGAVYSNAPVAGFSANVTSGATPLTVQFTDESTGSPTSWSWDFGDGKTSNDQNPVHTFSSAGDYTVTLTAGNSYGSRTKEKIDYISVLQAGTDLSITDSVVPLVSTAVFAREPNTVRVLYLKNNGNETMTDISVDLYASDVTGPVNGTTVASLGSGEEVQVQIIDPTIRNSEGGTVAYTAVVDPDNNIPELNETNNNMTGPAKPVKYNGYKGKAIYWKDGENITTRYTYELNGDIIYSFGDSSYVSGSSGGNLWLSHSVGWTADELPVPDNSEVVAARLYIPYTWDNSYQVPHNISVEFNDAVISYDYWDSDVSNFGAYSDYYYGLLSYDVTDLFEKNSDNTVTFTRSDDNAKLSLYGFTLAVIYENSTSSRKQIFINEGFDLLGASLTSYGTTPEEATAWVEFSGMTIDNSSADSASLVTFVPGGAGWDTYPGEGSLIVNGQTIDEYVWDYSSGTGGAVGEDDSPQVAVDTRDISSYLLSDGNVIGIRSFPDSSSPCMAAAQQILVVDYGIVPQANFTASPVEGTVPFEVNFTDNSTNSPDEWSWEFGDGGTSTELNPSHNYTYPGIYSVRLNVSNQNGTSSYLAERLINAAFPNIPTADFTSDANVGVSSLTVQFTDKSTGSPIEWFWEFGDGETSNKQNSSHTYSSTGLYDVTLTASNSDGSDSKTKSGYIEVVETSALSGYNDIKIKTANEPAYGQGDGTYYIGICEENGGLSDLHISTNPESPYGSISLTKSLTGAFYVTYTGDRGFQDDIILMLAVNGTIPEDFAVDISASGHNWAPSELGEEPETIASSSINRAFTKTDFEYGLQNWKPTGGNPNYPLFADEDMSDAGNTFRLMFIDLKSGVLGAGYENTTGKGSVKINYAFTNLTSFATFNVYGWNLNNSDGSQGIIETNSLSSGYSVYIPSASGDGGIVPYFSADNTSGEIPLIVTFNDSTSGTPASWLWEFGDGGNSTDQNPSHIYNMPGTYSINLTASNSKGSNSTLKVNYINVESGVLPEADFTSDKTSGTVPLTVNFKDNSTGNVTSWKWEFGDGGTSTEQNPSHTYKKAGEYSIRLTVNNSFGTDSIVKQNYLAVKEINGDAPVADFSLTPTSGSAPFFVTFTDKSTKSPTEWKWDFNNDGIIDSTAQNPSYTYRNTGTYSVSLTVSNTFGSDTLIRENVITVSGVKDSTQLQSIIIDNSGLTKNSDGSYSINSSDAEVDGNNIVIDSGNCTITIKSDTTPVGSGGTYVSSNVTEIELETEEVKTTLDGVGIVSGSVDVSLNDIPDSASLDIVLEEGDSGVGTSFQLAASSNGLDINSVAYTMNIVKTNLENGQDIKEATITMSVPVSWVNANGGISAIKIIRIAEDDTEEVLNTTYIGTNGNLMVFEGYSPNGLSLFGLASVTQQNASGSTSSSGSSGSDKTTTSRGRLDYKNSENPGDVQSSEEGKVLADTRVPSGDGFATVNIPKGTLALDKSGQPIDEIAIESTDSSVPDNDDPAVYEFMGKAYEFSPSGATFSPGIEITFYLSSFDEYEAFDGREPVIRYYDKAAKKWEELETVLNEDAMTVSATVTHFSLYALFAKSDGALSATISDDQETKTEPEAATTAEGTAVSMASTAQNSSSPVSAAIQLLFVVGFVGICSFGIYRFKKNNTEEKVFGHE